MKIVFRVAVVALVTACRAPVTTQPVPAPEPGSADAVRFITSDIPNFWRAFDAASSADSAGRVRAFHDLYLVPGSPGLSDWMFLRLANQRRILAAIESAGRTREWAGRAMQTPRGSPLRDSLEQMVLPVARLTAAEALARVTARYPRYFAGIRAQTLAFDTSSTMRTMVRTGLRDLARLAPDARFSDVYFVIGQLTSGGTTGESGMLIGAELSARTPETPIDELPESVQVMTSGLTPLQMAHLVVHETVHMIQAPLRDTTLLGKTLREGTADFLATIATGVRPDWKDYFRYGLANESRLWREFAGEMHGGDTSGWLYNYGSATTHGAPDLGYWIGFRIAEAYYSRVEDKQAAVRDLLAGDDPLRMLRVSGYGSEWNR